MKSDALRKAIGDVDEVLVERAERSPEKKNRKGTWLKIALPLAAAASLAGVIFLVIPKEKGNLGSSQLVGPPQLIEGVTESKYVWKVDSGTYAAYQPGKVIGEDRIGEALTDVTVTAGWVIYPSNEAVTKESLRGTVYAIRGVSPETGAAVRFHDKGEALTTDHYYVLLNPEADPKILEEYRIEEAAGAPENEGAVEE